MMARRWGILLFCLIYLALQGYAVISSHFRSDKRFGFWMFAESTRYSAKLYRELKDGRTVYAKKGRWSVTTPDGKQKRYSWNYFVRDFRLFNLEKYKRAKTGFAVTAKYLDYALDYVADHIPQDTETKRLILQIKLRRANGPWEYLTLTSNEREL